MTRGILTAAILATLAAPAAALPVQRIGPPSAVVAVQQRDDFTWQPPVYDFGSVAAPGAPVTAGGSLTPQVIPGDTTPQPPKPSVNWAYQWVTSGVGPDLYWLYALRCTDSERMNTDAGLCGPTPPATVSCRRGMTNVNAGQGTCTPGIAFYHSYRYEGCLRPPCQPVDSSIFDVDASGNQMTPTGKANQFRRQ